MGRGRRRDRGRRTKEERKEREGREGGKEEGNNQNGRESISRGYFPTCTIITENFGKTVD